MSEERGCALDAEGERLKAVEGTKPAPPRADAGEFQTVRRHAPMIASPGFDMLGRVGFTAGLIPGNTGTPHVSAKVERGEAVVKAADFDE